MRSRLHPAAAVLAGRLVLASGSPRRRELLELLGVAFDVVAPDVDETPRSGETPTELVGRLARAKALAVSARRPGAVVVGADTVVDVDGAVLGKPGSDDEVRRMLRLLSGRRHLVHTAVAVAVADRARVEVVTTAVAFAELAATDIEWYVATGEPHDKAGAYAVQGAGGVFVASIDGNPNNVVGLPLTTLVSMLAAVSSEA